MHAGLCSSVFLFREDSHKVLYTEFYPILSPGSPRSQGGYRMREVKGRFSPIPESRSLKRMALSASSSSSLRLLYLPSRSHLVFTIFPFLSLSLPPSFLLPAILSLILERLTTSPPSLSDLQPHFFLRFFLELRLSRICQDYLSFAKGRSRFNLKHHLNKRGVTARLLPAGRNERVRNRVSSVRPMTILMTSWYLWGKKRTPRSLLSTGWDSCHQGSHLRQRVMILVHRFAVIATPTHRSKKEF